MSSSNGSGNEVKAATLADILGTARSQAAESAVSRGGGVHYGASNVRFEAMGGEGNLHPAFSGARLEFDQSRWRAGRGHR